MRVHLVDLNARLVASWTDAFRGLPGVTIAQNDILAVAHDTLVSPANSYGHMDGGIDRAYSAYLGPSVQRAVYAAVARRPEGRIPVGSAEIIDTGHPRVARLVVAPTMEVPEEVPASHCYRALRAALRVVDRYRDRVSDVFCPGLATGIGRVPEPDAAREMAAAYRDWLAARESP